MREIKIKLSRKEKELAEVQESLAKAMQKITLKDVEVTAL
jgi:hypothetical protein